MIETHDRRSITYNIVNLKIWANVWRLESKQFSNEMIINNSGVTFLKQDTDASKGD